jgi:hypothetical protein
MRSSGNLTVRTNTFSGIEQIRPSVVYTRLVTVEELGDPLNL